jgi:hypothetical protein
VARCHIEGCHGVRKPVLAVVHFSERNEKIGSFFPLCGRHLLARLDSLEDGRSELLHERRIVLGDAASLA